MAHSRFANAGQIHASARKRGAGPKVLHGLKLALTSRKHVAEVSIEERRNINQGIARANINQALRQN